MEDKLCSEMKAIEQSIGMLGYRPTLLGSMKISYIVEVFGLNNCAVIREILRGHRTLDELHSLARKTSPDRHGVTLPYLAKAFAPNKSIEIIIKDGDRLYTKGILGISEIDDQE